MMPPRWEWPQNCQISPQVRAEIEAEAAAMEAPKRPADDSLARRVRALERRLAPSGKFLNGLLDAIGEALGQRDARLAELDVRVEAITGGLSKGARPRIRVRAGSRRIAP